MVLTVGETSGFTEAAAEVATGATDISAATEGCATVVDARAEAARVESAVVATDVTLAVAIEVVARATNDASGSSSGLREAARVESSVVATDVACAVAIEVVVGATNDATRSTVVGTSARVESGEVATDVTEAVATEVVARATNDASADGVAEAAVADGLNSSDSSSEKRKDEVFHLKFFYKDEFCALF